MIRLPAIIIISIFLFSNNAAAQQTTLSLENQSLNKYEHCLNSKKILFHTSFKPYLLSSIPSGCDNDTLFAWMKKRKEATTVGGKCIAAFLHKNFIKIQEDDFVITINPYMDFELGKDFEWNNRTYTNSRGVMINGDIGKKFSFETFFSENQSIFPHYVFDFVKDSQVVPSIGRAIKFKNDNSFDYASGYGYVSFTPDKHFNFQLGQSKNFIGDGYRSLLLSDNSVSYPLLKVTTTVGKFQYTNIWAQMLDTRTQAKLGIGFRRKFLAAHHLSILLGKSFEIGFFESVIWQASDSGSYRGFDFSYLNPIIYYHSVQWNLGSPDNSILGTTFKWKISNQLTFYNQFLLDDFDLALSKGKKGFYRNKYAYQLGLKYFNAFNLKGFFIQAEYNEVWPYTYSHKLPVMNYAHYNQPLAHPLGANFREALLFLHYNLHRWFAGVEFMYVLSGIDSASGNVGQNIYLSDFSIPNSYDTKGNFIGTYGNYVGQGIGSTILFTELKLNYLINRNNNLIAEISYTMRNQTIVNESSKANFITFGIKTSLFNHYFDF